MVNFARPKLHPATTGMRVLDFNDIEEFFTKSNLKGTTCIGRATLFYG